jgi:DNA-binding transcriptional LysR family regulator
MEMSQLEFFVKVAEEGSFSRAADSVSRTQPAVSIAVRRLEEEIGAPLFDRAQKIPVLTDVGRVVLDYAQRILKLRDQAREAVSEIQTLETGRVRIGANESTSLYLLPEIILAFRNEHPRIKLEITRFPSDQLPREVLDRNIDFALMAFEPKDRDLESFPILEDELILIMHPKHQLVSAGSVTVKELGSESFLAHNVKSGSRQKVVETFAKLNTPLNISLELATVETIKRFVQKRMGLAFVPRMCVTDELARGTLKTIPVKGLSYSRTLWATHRRGAAHGPAVAAFLDVLRSQTHIVD